MDNNEQTIITPVWRRYTLIDEHPHENFYVMNGNRVLIKRAKFEDYLDQETAV